MWSPLSALRPPLLASLFLLSRLAAAGPSPATAAQQPRPPCTMTIGASYWDGQTWRLMTTASFLQSDSNMSLTQGLKNPFIPRRAHNNITILRNPAASLTLAATPIFCVRLPATADSQAIMLGTLDVKKGRRELETCAGRCGAAGRSPAGDWLPQKHVQPVELNRTSDTTVEITPKSPLKPGQYVLGGPTAGLGFYDFGVSETAAQTVP